MADGEFPRLARPEVTLDQVADVLGARAALVTALATVQVAARHLRGLDRTAAEGLARSGMSVCSATVATLSAWLKDNEEGVVELARLFAAQQREAGRARQEG
jgi:hypothetical protein